VAFLLEDSKSRVLLTQRKLLPLLPPHSVEVLCLEDTGDLEDFADLPSTVRADNLAYLIYTSGSTGKPKGVAVTHANVVASTAARLSYYHEPVRRFLLLPSFAFDSSVAGIFWTLCQGGALELLRADLAKDPAALAELVARNRVSHLLCIPAFYSAMLASNPASLTSLSTVIVAGETCPTALVSAHFAALPHGGLFNEYGPTEGTVWCTVHECRESPAAVQVPIGRPIPNARVYVLSPTRQPQPVGVPGELYVGGSGVARGYWRRPELTAEKFGPDPFGHDPGTRLFRTGDLARWLLDGNLEFLGRADHQVKIRGYRVELGEIEAVLAQHSAVRRAIVVVREDAPGEKRLVAYVVPASEPDLAASELRSFLAEKLADYMVPSAFVLLDELPLSPHGKLDKLALPVPERRTLDQPFVAPRNAIQEAVASVWSELLREGRVGANDNFFDLGGHSLLAMQVISRIRNLLGLEVPLRVVFDAPTLEGFSSALLNYESSPGQTEKIAGLLA
jgi:amino acid adenylation domain-containing protein